MNLDDVKTLIDNASKVCGSDSKLAQTLDVSRALISDWRHGRKRCAPEDIAIIASIAGFDANAWAMRAMVWRWEGTPKGDRLMRALGKGLLVTGGVLASAGANAAAIFSSTSASGIAELVPIGLYTMYRKVKSIGRRFQIAFITKAPSYGAFFIGYGLHVG
jgi:DNA-binding transcriptional regulator YdaS (Cro superfamily)